MYAGVCDGDGAADHGSGSLNARGSYEDVRLVGEEEVAPLKEKEPGGRARGALNLTGTGGRTRRDGQSSGQSTAQTHDAT